jgi:pilus assembly protein TadC
MRRVAFLCPLGAVAEALEGRLSRMLSSARVYLSPRIYSRFTVSLLVYPAFAEALVALAVPQAQALFLLASLAIIQLLPFLIPLGLSGSRKKSVDAELPFFLVMLSIFSHDSSPTIDDALRRVASLGDGVLPALRHESEVLERDMTFMPGSPTQVLESAFSSHPSRSLRDFVHSFTITLTTGKSVEQYVEQEAQRQVSLLEGRWKGFSESVASLAEVSLMVLALFPVGVEMIASAIPGFASSQMLLISLAALAGFSAVLLVVLESVQPVSRNSTPSARFLAMTLASWTACTLLYYVAAIPITISLVVPLAVSAFGFLRTRKVYDRIRRGEEEVSLLLHDLAEESKAGVSLPEALSKISSGTSRYQSIGGPLAAFHHAIMLGSSPAEAQKKISHPSWLVRLSFGMLAVAFSTGAGFEQLERLSSFFKRATDARRNASRALLPFVLIGVVVPVISVASMNFLGGLNSAGGIPFLPSFGSVSQSYLLISISAVSLLTGLLLSKLFTQTSKHAVAVPILLASTLVSLLVFGVA